MLIRPSFDPEPRSFTGLTDGQFDAAFVYARLDDTLADPAVKRQKRVLQGDVPSPVNPPSGCHFHTRCPYAVARCKVETPLLREIAPGHHVSCHLR